MKHAPAWLSAATAGKAMAFIVAGGVLLVIILLARAVGRLSKLARAAAAPAPAPARSGGKGKLLLLGGAAVAGVWVLARAGHPVASTAVKAAPKPSPAPAPSPHPTLIQTVVPNATPAIHHPFMLTGGDIVALYAIAAVVAIALGVQALRSRS